MGKVIIVCGKICSGKSYYSKSIKDSLNAVIISPDEATYELINNEQGEFYNIFSERLNKYLTKKAGEIAQAGANVIFERGLWSKKDRESIKEYYESNGIECEIHYVCVDDETWKQNIAERNKKIDEGKGGSDFYLDDSMSISYVNNDDYKGYSNNRLSEVLTRAWEHIDDLFLFKNWQFIDTGYRDDSLERNKRYRELQLQLNNIEGADLNFGFSFILDGEERYSYYQYDTEHIIDENDPNYGLIYILGSPYMNLNMNRLEVPNETILGEDINAWSLKQSLFPEISLWKIRAHISGKGAAPRMKLLSRNVNRFEIMNINWVCRYMNTR